MAGFSYQIVVTDAIQNMPRRPQGQENAHPRKCTRHFRHADPLLRDEELHQCVCRCSESMRQMARNDGGGGPLGPGGLDESPGSGKLIPIQRVS